MTKNMNIIIVSDVPPDAGYTAGQVLHQTITGLSEYQFRFYWLNQSNLKTDIATPNNCKTIAIVGTQYGSALGFLVRGCNFLLRKMPFIAKPIYAIKTALALCSLVSKAVKMGLMIRNDPANLLWFVVQGERTTITYRIVSWIAQKPYLLQQWDPLSWWMGHRQYPKRLIQTAQKLLHRLEQAALINIVPSDAWKEKLQQEGKSATRLDNFISQRLLDEPHFVAVQEPSTLHAVFVGQFYAGQELVRTVDALNRSLKLTGHRLVIHVFGSSTDVQFNDCEVITHGFLDRDALIRRISKWDLALLPYPTSAGHEETARLSFPSKARVYLAAGLPILACAPMLSGVHRFLSEHYTNHYNNIEMNNHPTNFISNLLEASYTRRVTRFKEARNLVSAEFSDVAELQTLRTIMGAAI
jgi:uncharacterized membrane protein YfbV (UPF0208 family)